MRHRIVPFALLFLAAFALGCATATEAPEEPAAEEAAVDEGGDQPALPADERDEYSKPFEVYEFLGIEAGNTVVDLLAGGGYNAERIAHVVGSEGLVIVDRGREEFQARTVDGDLADFNFQFVGDVAEIEDATADVIVAVRAYHLFEDVPAKLADLSRALKPGGVVGVVELRTNTEEGHDMDTHRVGEQTVIADFEAAGFEFVEESDLLRRDDDDYTVYRVEGRQRYQSDRLLLKFRKPAM